VIAKTHRTFGTKKQFSVFSFLKKLVGPTVLGNSTPLMIALKEEGEAARGINLACFYLAK
jgi:hypothetical protein